MILEVDETFTTKWLSRSSEVRVKVRRWPQSPIGTILLFQNIPTSQSHFKFTVMDVDALQTFGEHPRVPSFHPSPAFPSLPQWRIWDVLGVTVERLWGGVFPVPTRGRVSQNFLDFWVENGAFWCILGAIFADCSNLKLFWLLFFISVFPLRMEKGVWEKGCTPLPRKILTYEWKVARFGAF